MPRKTFMNLPPERQKRIINVSLEEFSQNDFESASLSAIISRLNLAKGSFYRYFESKESLYAYLAGFCRELFTVNTKRLLNAPEKEFAEMWLDIFQSFKRYEAEYPFIIRFWVKSAQDKRLYPKDASEDDAIREKLAMMKESLSGRADGDGLRSDIDIGYISFVILYHLMALIEYISFTYGIRPDQPVFSPTDEQLREEVHRFITVLQKGIHSR